MNESNQIGFISTRIKQLETAVVQSGSDNWLHLKDITVHAIDVDEGGYVWFTVLKPAESIAQYPSSFDVELNFYKKGMPFCLNLSGKAKLVSAPLEIRELPAYIQQQVTADRLLVSVKIMNVDYYEEEPQKAGNWLQGIKNKWSNALHPAGYFSLNNLRVQMGGLRDRLS